MVPVSVRTEEQRGTYGNRVSAMIVELPTDESDPIARYERMRAAMSIAKEQHGAIPAEMLQDFAQFTPPSVLGMAGRVAARMNLADRVNLPFNVVISNVPGPQFPLYSAGAMLRGIYPLSAISDGVGPEHDPHVVQRQPRLRAARLPRDDPRHLAPHRRARQRSWRRC